MSTIHTVHTHSNSTPALNIIVLDSAANYKPITLRVLAEKFILAPEFRGQTTLRYDQILEFTRRHPAYAVRVQSAFASNTASTASTTNKGGN